MRDGKLDFYKAFLIWSVVLGHCINALCPSGNYLHLALRTFDLPMFMYISGFLLNGSIARYDMNQLVLNKVTSIVVPAIIWICISYLLGDKHMYYFLWAIFFSSVIVCLFSHISAEINNRHEARIISYIETTLIVLTAFGLHLVPVNIVNISYLFPFFVVGYFSNNISNISWKWGCMSLALFAYLIAFVWTPQYTIWNTGGYILQNTAFMIKVVTLRILIGLSGIYAVSFLLGALYDMFKSDRIIGFIQNVGKETLSIYLMQHIVVEILLVRLVRYLNINGILRNHEIIVGYIITPLISVILLLVMYGFVFILKKSECTRWLFGFKIKLKAIARER